MRRLLVAALTAIVVVGAIGAVRAMRLRSTQVPPATPASIVVDAGAAAERLAAALRFPTISWGDASKRDAAAFAGLRAHLTQSFPRVAASLDVEALDTHALLYTWRGTQPTRPPVLMLAHLDVVPAGDEGDRRWTHPPFAGTIADGSVWGRGAIDDKSGALGILEAVDALLATGFAPTRTVYLAFSHNEEGDGDPSGASTLARTLQARGVRDAWLLDEGGLVYDKVPGVDGRVAFVGITEKTAIGVELRVSSAGGHASMPPAETAVGILARAIDRVEGHPMPARLDGAARQMFLTLAPEMHGAMRVAFANLWLAEPLVLRQLTARPDTNAIVRTTIAPTQLEGSAKVNVLATDARAMLNVRLLPGDTPDAVLAHLRHAVDDERVAIRLADAGGPPAPISSTTTREFETLQAAIRAVYPDVRVAPFMTTGATDARLYAAIAPFAYRFLPIAQPGALDTIHGVDEHIRIDAYVDAIRTYATIVTSIAGR
jgi:carboxypeptidase PM20D1